MILGHEQNPAACHLDEAMQRLLIVCFGRGDFVLRGVEVGTGGTIAALSSVAKK